MKYIKALLSLMDSYDKRKLFLLGFLMFVAALIELIGVGSLFPYIKILGDPSVIHTNRYLNEFYNMFSFSNQIAFMIFLGFVIFLLILGKGAITCFNNYMQAKFSSRMNNKIANKILKRYVGMDYAEFVKTNSAAMSKHLLYDVQNVISVISSILNMVTSIVVGTSLVILMLLADFWVVMASVSVLLFFLQLTAKLTKSRMNKLAKSNESNYRSAYKNALEAFSGMKDIKIFGVEKYFVDRYNWTRSILSSHLIQFNVISNLPTVVMNVVGFGVLMCVLLYLLFTKGNIVAVLPVIAIIAICIQRLLPTITTVSASISLIRRYKPVVFIVSDAQSQPDESVSAKQDIEVSEKISFNKSIKVDHISFSYPDSQDLALDNIVFEIQKNSTVGIVGASGAGKSTLLDVMLGIYAPTRGKIFCDEKEINRSNYSHFRQLIGYVPQRTFLLDGTIKENIAFGIPEQNIDYDNLMKAVRISQLNELVDQLPEGIETWVGENALKLSGGQRQRLGIARALYHDPEIIILDEATNALDSVTETEFNESLKALMNYKTLIIIAHRQTSIDFCDYLLVVEKGKIVSQGSYQSVIAQKEFRELYPDSANV